MARCVSRLMDLFNADQDRIADFDMHLGDTLAEALNSALSDYIAGDICGFDLLVKVTKAVDVAQDAVSALDD